MNSAQVIHSFWASFGWETYDENSVPDDAGFPRLTYDIVKSELDDKTTMSANLFNKSSSWATLEEKAKQIEDYIGKGGKLFKYDGGGVWITKATPFSRRTSESDTVKQIVININAEYIE